MANNYELLLAKINEFTQKFYLNKLLRGIIYTLAVLLSAYLLLFVLVYYFHPGIVIKTILFYAYLLFFFLSVGIQIIKPGLAYFKFIKNISTKESAVMIGSHFQEIRDKLINTLQLKELADLSPQHNELILAGIDQKINDLKPIPFSNAIRLEENKKYIKYFLIPLLIILLIGIIAPAILKEGTSSFVQYNKVIMPKAPFDFKLVNKSLTVVQGDSLRIELQLNGNQLPQEVYLQEGLNTYKLEKDKISRFHYTFKNIQKNKTIYFNAGGFSSQPFEVNVKPRPGIIGLNATLTFPAYLHKKEEAVQNAGDLLVPEGTTINWSIATENSNRVSFILNNKVNPLSIQNHSSHFKARIVKNSNYRVTPANDFAGLSDSVNHKIEVIADLAPEISVLENPDSLSSKSIYFKGKTTDDHGFSGLKFIYTIKNKELKQRSVSVSLPIKKDKTENSFFHFLNVNLIPLKQGETLEYFFEVRDNDEVNGYKSARTAVKTYTVPSQQQIAKQLNEGSTALKQKMDAAIKLAGEVEKESKKLGERMLDKKALSFADKKEVSQLLDKQKKLEAAVQEIKSLKEKNTLNLQENDALKSELAEKQKQIDDLFNNVLDPKTKALLENLQSLMEQNNKDQTQSELSKMNMDNKSLKNELDRILELYKQLEFEQNLQNKIDRLNVIAKAQKDLSNKSRDKKADVNALKTQQKQLADDFNALKKELKQLEEKNQSLEKPNPFQNPEKESQQIQNQQQQSLQQLDKKNKENAAASQEKAAKQMQDLSEKMNAEQQQSEEMESNLNIEELRVILKNLLYSSFEQEKVMLNIKKMNSNDPSYITNVQEQQGLKDNMKTIADSLSSLSKRVPQIESTVTEEMQKINFNIDKSLSNLSERRTSEALKNQQYSMTSINNLALMLNEVMDQLEKNKNKSSKGGKGKQSMQQLQQMQQQLNKNIQQAKDRMQQEGNKGSVPKGKFSEEFAKMAQQQQMIREALQKINSEENKDGKGSLGNLNQLIKEMKMTETDLVNKRLEQETINRQKGLLTKLLDADKASREQEEDEKRESKAAKDFPPSYHKMLEEFKKRQVNETELLQKLPPDLNYYYKNKIFNYFKLLNLQ